MTGPVAPAPGKTGLVVASSPDDGWTPLERLSGRDPAIDLDGLVQRVARSTGMPAGRVRRVIAATFAELAGAMPQTAEPREPAQAAAGPADGDPPAPVDPYRWLPLRRSTGRWP